MRDLIKEFKNYLLSKEERTEQENALIKKCDIELEYYPISYITFSDLEKYAEDLDIRDMSNISEDDIDKIANKMGDYYGDTGGFANDLYDAMQCILKV